MHYSSDNGRVCHISCVRKNCHKASQEPAMMSVLRTALCLFAGLVRVSRSVHFTNAEWEVYENQSITLEWAYDSDDNPDPDEYAITIWLPFGTELLPWSGNYSHMLFNSMLLLPPFSVVFLK